MWKPHTDWFGTGRGGARVSRATQREDCVAYRLPRSAWMRASVGGCVLKSDIRP